MKEGIPISEDTELRRLLLVATGSRTVHTLPSWLDWLRDHRPELDFTVVLTHSAERFTTLGALHGLTGTVHRDEWPEGDGEAWHVRWERWAQAIVVFPATLHFIARLALGLADTPVLLAAQCSTAPVVLAPALPPGGLESAAYQQHHTALLRRPNVAIATPVPNGSASTGGMDAWGPPPLYEVLDLANTMRARTPEPVPGVVTSLADGAL